MLNPVPSLWILYYETCANAPWYQPSVDTEPVGPLPLFYPSGLGTHGILSNQRASNELMKNRSLQHWEATMSKVPLPN